MKSLIFLAVLTCALAAMERYRVKIFKDYETMPLPEIESIVDCVVYEVGCTPMSDAYRAAYPEVIHTACQFCTDEQKIAAYQFYNRIIRDLPKKHQDLRKKFDPDNKYYDNFHRVLELSVQNENQVLNNLNK